MALVLEPAAQIVAHWHSAGFKLEGRLILRLLSLIGEAFRALLSILLLFLFSSLSISLLLVFVLVLRVLLLLILLIMVLLVFAIPIFVA